jgi:hypothetical protein
MTNDRIKEKEIQVEIIGKRHISKGKDISVQKWKKRGEGLDWRGRTEERRQNETEE